MWTFIGRRPRKASTSSRRAGSGSPHPRQGGEVGSRLWLPRRGQEGLAGGGLATRICNRSNSAGRPESSGRAGGGEILQSSAPRWRAPARGGRPVGSGDQDPSPRLSGVSFIGEDSTDSGGVDKAGGLGFPPMRVRTLSPCCADLSAGSRILRSALRFRSRDEPAHGVMEILRPGRLCRIGGPRSSRGIGRGTRVAQRRWTRHGSPEDLEEQGKLASRRFFLTRSRTAWTGRRRPRAQANADQHEVWKIDYASTRRAGRSGEAQAHRPRREGGYNAEAAQLNMDRPFAGRGTRGAWRSRAGGEGRVIAKLGSHAIDRPSWSRAGGSWPKVLVVPGLP